MRIATTLLLLLSAAGCTGMQGTYATPAASRAAASALAGIWTVTQVNAHDLPAPSPQEPKVTVERASLMLQAGHQYSLSITAHTGAEMPNTVNQSGTWSAAGNTLTLNASTGRATRFAYTLTQSSLTLRDGSTVYTLVRS